MGPMKSPIPQKVLKRLSDELEIKSSNGPIERSLLEVVQKLMCYSKHNESTSSYYNNAFEV